MKTAKPLSDLQEGQSQRTVTKWQRLLVGLSLV